MSIDWITIFLSAAINTPVVGALAAFLGKRMLQRQTHQHNRELQHLKAEYTKQLEAYKNELGRSKSMFQSEIDRTILVTKVHFQTEFKALRQIFEKLSELLFRIAPLHPEMRIARESETREERLRQLGGQLEQVHIAYDALLTTSEHMRPFYPDEIYDAVRECLRWAHVEDTHVKLAGNDVFSLQWSKTGESNVIAFRGSYKRVVDLIRDRISKLAILPGV